MSTFGGPNSNRDGLVLYVDAGNSKSFRGEPTTNNANQSIVGATQTSVSSIDIVGPDGKVVTASKVTINSATGVTRIQMYNISNVVPILEQYYTISVWVKRGNNVNITGGWESELANDQVYTYARPGLEIGYTGVYNSHPNTQTIPVEWTRVIYTFKYAVQPTAIVNHFFYFSGLGGEVLFYGFQFEEKSYETPFVIGTRGSTVATGGGLIDLKKNGNNGEVVSGITYNSSKSGNLVFDGSTGYINIATTVAMGNPNTVSAFIKLSGSNVSSVIYGPLANGSDNWLGIDNNKILLFGTQSQDVNNFSIAGTTTLDITNTKWYHVTSTVNDNVATLYLNGTLESSVSQAFTIASWSSSADIGRRAGLVQRYFLGSISNVQVYNRALTASEVLQNYNASKSRFGL